MSKFREKSIRLLIARKLHVRFSSNIAHSTRTLEAHNIAVHGLYLKINRKKVIRDFPTLFANYVFICIINCHYTYSSITLGAVGKITGRLIVYAPEGGVAIQQSDSLQINVKYAQKSPKLPLHNVHVPCS